MTEQPLPSYPEQTAYDYGFRQEISRDSQRPSQQGVPGGGQPPESSERLWAVLAHLSGVLCWLIALGFLGPLLVLLVQGRTSPYVRRHAVEALNFHVLLLILWLVGLGAIILTLGVGLLIVVPTAFVVVIAALVFTVMASVAAKNGRDYRHPVNLRIVR